MTETAGGEVRTDAFLGGRLQLFQPAAGYRASTDPVLLAAAAPVETGDEVLDLGCGVGTVGLCVARRVPGVRLSGLELQESYAGLARRNAEINSITMTVCAGDLREMPAALRTVPFDCVLMNPPWFADDHPGAADLGRNRARRENGATLDEWIGVALARLKQRGWLVIVHRTERLPEVLAALDGRAGAIAVLPLVARAGRAAERVIVRARKDVRSPFCLASPFVLHAGSEHVADGDDYTAEARAILRDAKPLTF